MENAIQNSNTETHSFFNNKDHYMAFRQAWKNFINEGHHEKKKTIHENHDGSTWTSVTKSPLACVHHLIYNGLRKQDLHKSFSPLKHKGRLNARGSAPYGAFHSAIGFLGVAAKGDNTPYDWLNAQRLDVLKPFGGTVTTEMLQELYESLKDVELD